MRLLSYIKSEISKNKKFWLCVLGAVCLSLAVTLAGHVWGANTANGIGNMVAIIGILIFLAYYYFGRKKTSAKEKKRALLLIAFFLAVVLFLIR